MSEEPLLPAPNPDYHLDYDTNEMTKEEHLRLKVAPVKVPVTPNFNIHRMFFNLHTQYPRRFGEDDDAWDKRLYRASSLGGTARVPRGADRGAHPQVDILGSIIRYPQSAYVDVLAAARRTWFRQDPDRGRMD
jgi:hypothetical protein